MQFYFDESGDFAVPNDPTRHSVGIVAGVDIPETTEAEVTERFQRFVQGLSPVELKDGEPKGKMLHDNSLRTFAEMIADCRQVFLTTKLLDLTSLSGGKEQQAIDASIHKLNEAAAKCVHETMRDQLLELASQVRNLNPVQLLRIVAWAACIEQVIHDCITLRHGPSYNSCWHTLRFVIDPVQRQKRSREQQVFEKMLPAWLTGWSRTRPFALIEEAHTVEHPFVKKYETDVGIDIGLMVRNNVQWPSSATTVGLQIADISATIVRKAAGGHGVIDMDTLNTYGKLMTRSPLSPYYAVGVLLLGNIDPREIGDRYAGLMEAIKTARPAAA